jgi:lipopolysaccharide export system protein LptA
MAGFMGGLIGCIPLTAHAEQADRNKPLVYAADHLSYDDLKQTTILTGNVELTKGTIIVRGDRAEIHQDPEGYSYATATSDKGLAYIREKRDGVNEYFEGQGKRIDYDGKNDVSTLTGQAVARRLSGLTTTIDEVHGTVIRYDGVTGFYTATSSAGTKTGGSASARVRGMIAPTTTTPTTPPPVTAPSPRASGSLSGSPSRNPTTTSAPVSTAPSSSSSPAQDGELALPASAVTPLAPAQSLENAE